MKDWSSRAVFDGAQTELWSKCTAAPELSVTLLPMTVPKTGELTDTEESARKSARRARRRR